MAQLPPELIRRARELRGNATDAELLLWRLIRRRALGGARFRRQHCIPPYIVDFCCLEAKLVVEVDGGQHGEDEGIARDRKRDAYVRQRGFRVLRFWNNQVFRETEGVLESIWIAVHGRSPDECDEQGVPPP
jgi:very-short-patch-repair endonuclease